MSQASELRDSVWPSVAFWLSAVASAALVAAVLLAPKLEVGEGLTRRARELAEECQKLDRTNANLRQLVDSLQHDPNLIGELARSEFDLGVAGEERLPVPAEPARVEDAAAQPTTRASGGGALEPWWRPVHELFVRDEYVRQVSLAVAAVLIVTGFTFFQCPAERTKTGRRGRGGDDEDEDSDVEERRLDEIERFVRGYKKRGR